MKQLTEEQFHALREGIAGAHLLIQRVIPLMKARRTTLDSDTRKLTNEVPGAVADAFRVAAALSTDDEPLPPNRLPPNLERMTDVDWKLFRLELENVSALVLPDLIYECGCACTELPMYREATKGSEMADSPIPRVMSWAWEAGRRYAYVESLAVLHTAIDEFNDTLTRVYETSRDRNLEVENVATLGLDEATGPQRVQ